MKKLAALLVLFIFVIPLTIYGGTFSLTLAVSPAGSGSISQENLTDPFTPLQAGQTARFTATGETGYIFDYFHVNIVGVETYETDSNPMQLTLPDEEIIITAHFIEGYELDVIWDDIAGDVEIYADGVELTEFPVALAADADLNLSATASEYYSFGWYDIDDGISTWTHLFPNLNWTMPSRDLTITVEFEDPPGLQVDFTWDSNAGDVTVYNITRDISYMFTTTVNLYQGDYIEITADTNEGYIFDYWLITDEWGNWVATVDDLTHVRQITYDLNIEAVFYPIPTGTLDVFLFSEFMGSVEVINNTGGYNIISFPATVPIGDELTIIATANEGYAFNEYWVYVDNLFPKDIYSPSTINITMSDDVEVWARFYEYEGTMPLPGDPPVSNTLTNFITVIEKFGFTGTIGHALFIALALLIANILLIMVRVPGFPLLIINGALITLFAFGVLIPVWVTLTIIFILGMILISMKGVLSND